MLGFHISAKASSNFVSLKTFHRHYHTATNYRSRVRSIAIIAVHIAVWLRYCIEKLSENHFTVKTCLIEIVDIAKNAKKFVV